MNTHNNSIDLPLHPPPPPIRPPPSPSNQTIDIIYGSAPSPPPPGTASTRPPVNPSHYHQPSFFPNIPPHSSPSINPLHNYSTQFNLLPSSQPVSHFTSQFSQITLLSIPISTKLSHNNFLTWKSQLLLLINGRNLSVFLSHSAPNPTFLDSSGHIQINPDFLPWSRQDQLLLEWLRSSLPEPIQAQVVSCSASAELWSNLQHIFSSNSRARLIDLKR